MKAIRILALALGVYVLVGLLFEASTAYFQRQTPGFTVVLRSFDESGHAHDTVLALHDDEGQLWVESGHWFRGWYHRLRANPDVELIRDGQALAYRATPVDTPEEVERMKQRMGKGQGATYWVFRALLLWAPVKPVRLDPRPEAAG